MRLRGVRSRWLRALMVVAVGVLLTAIVFTRLQAEEQRRIAFDFERDASDRVSAFRLAMVHGLDVLVALDALFSSGLEIDRAAFRDFTGEHLIDEPGVEFLAWAPRVRQGDVLRFEATVRRERIGASEDGDTFDGFTVFSKQPDSGQSRPALAADRFPILYAVPAVSRLYPLGFDLWSDPDQRDALRRARDNGESTAGPRVMVGSAAQDEMGFLVYNPVYTLARSLTGGETRADALSGYVVGMFSVTKIMGSALEGLEPRGIDIAIHDVSALPTESLLHFHSSRASAEMGEPWTVDDALQPRGLGIARTLRLANRDWLVSCRPAGGYVAARETWAPQVALVSGLLLTGLMAGYVFILMSRAAASQEDAQELRVAKRELEREAAERERAQAELAQSEERFRRAFDDAPVGMGVVDLDGRFMQANQALAEMLGYDLAELLTMAASEITHPDDQAREAELMADLVSGSTDRLQVVERLLRRDGSTIWAEISISLVRDQVGRPLYFIGQQQDVSVRKATEDALRVVRETQAQILDGLPLNVFLKDADGELEFLNARARELLGVSADEDITGKTDFDLFPKSVASELQAGDRRAIEQGEILNLEEEIEVDGRTVHLLAGKKILTLGGSERPFLLGFSIDVTDLKRTEEALRASELRFRELVENMSAGVAVFEAVDEGLDFVFRDYNRAAERMDKRRREEVIGRRLLEVFPGAAAMGLVDALRRVWRTGEAERMPLTVYQDERLESWRENYVYRIPSGEIVAVFDDVSERKRMEAELLHAQKMEAIGRLAGGVAHDFNNLLQVVVGNADLLLERDLRGPEAEEMLTEIRRQADRGAQLARRLLVFSRRESEQPELLDLGEVIATASRMVGRLLKENISVSVEISDEPLPVIADRGQLEQVLMNLVVNASDAMPEGGKLSIKSGSEAEGEVWISVADSGSGIPAGLIDKIFEPYFTTKSATQGTGLGLAVVDGIVTVHGGRIMVDNRPGEGVEFKVILPRAEAVMQKTEASPGERPQSRGRGQRVLVVEDQELVRKTMETMLTSLGYLVTSVADGAEARRRVGELAFDLLVTDVVLTDTSGVELAQEFRAQKPTLAVLLVSGYAEEALRQGGSDLRFLQKPFRLDDLAREVAAALGESKPI